MDIKDWCSWVKEMVTMVSTLYIISFVGLISGIVSGVSPNTAKILSYLLGGISGFSLMFIAPYLKSKKDRDELKKCRKDILELKNKLDELQPLVNFEKERQIILPFKKKLENIIDTLCNYIIPNQGNNYSFKKFIDSVQFESKFLKDCLKFNSNILEKLCSYYRARFEESFNLSILMNELNGFGLIIQEIFKYLKDNENNIKDFDKLQYKFFVDTHTSVGQNYSKLLNEIPKEVKKKININSFTSLPNIGDI